MTEEEIKNLKIIIPDWKMLNFSLPIMNSILNPNPYKIEEHEAKFFVAYLLIAQIRDILKSNEDIEELICGTNEEFNEIVKIKCPNIFDWYYKGN